MYNITVTRKTVSQSFNEKYIHCIHFTILPFWSLRESGQTQNGDPGALFPQSQRSSAAIMGEGQHARPPRLNLANKGIIQLQRQHFRICHGTQHLESPVYKECAMNIFANIDIRVYM